MGKATLSISFLVILLCYLPFLASGGAMVTKSQGIWELSDENTLVAAINHYNNTEHLIIMVQSNEDLASKDSIWLFPLPATADQIKANVIKGFPLLRGYDLKNQADRKMEKTLFFMTGSQIYTIPLYLGIINTGKGMENTDIGMQVEKMGLTTQVFTAKGSGSLAEYLKNRSITVPETMTSAIESYASQDYSFVVSWISNLTEFQESQDDSTIGRNSIGVSVSFPAEKPFFPLMMASAYGKKTIPTQVYVMGHVQPRIYEEIAGHTRVRYFRSSTTGLPGGFDEFFMGYTLRDQFSTNPRYLHPEGIVLEWTVIEINAPSEAFSQDLWMENASPKKVQLYDSMASHPVLWGFLIFAVLSVLSSMIAGLVVFRAEKPSAWRFLLFGLYNFLTLIGFWILALLLDVDRRFTDKKDTLDQRVDLTLGKRLAILIPTIIIGIIITLIPVTYLLDLDKLYFPVIFSPVILLLMLPLFVFIPLVLWGIFKHRRAMNFVLAFSITFLVLLYISTLIINSI